MENRCFRLYFKYMILNVLGMLGLSCYILVDTFFISLWLGSKGLTALNLAIPVFSFINGVGLMLGMGGATQYSILKCQEKEEQKNRVFTNTVFLYVGFCVIFLALGIWGSDFITRLFGADEAVFSMTKTYIQVLFLFSPAFLLNQVIQCFVRNDGAPQLSMAAMLGGSFSNIFLDYLFIFVFDMGMFGAVLATSFAPIIGLSIMSPFFIKKRNQFHLVKCKLNGRVAGIVLAGGAPSLVAELSSGIVIIIFNVIILGLEGNIGVAAYGVIANLSIVAIAVYNGIAQGVQPLISQYYGSGLTGNMKKVLKYAVGTVVIVSIIIYVGIFWGADSITYIFNSEKNAELQIMAVKGLKLYFAGCLFAGFNMVLSIYFTAMDKAKPANTISILRGFVLIVPIAFLLSAVGKMTGLWLAFPVTELLVSLLGIGLLCKQRLR